MDDRCDSGTVLESSSSDEALSDIDAARLDLPSSRPSLHRPPLLHPIPRLNLVIDLSQPHPVTLDTPTRTLSRAGKKSVSFLEEVEQAVIVDDESDLDDEFEDEEEDMARQKPPRPPKPMTKRIAMGKLQGSIVKQPSPPPKPKAKKSLASSLISAPIPGREQIGSMVDRGIDVWENVRELVGWVGIVVVAGAFARVS